MSRSTLTQVLLAVVSAIGLVFAAYQIVQLVEARADAQLFEAARPCGAGGIAPNCITLEVADVVAVKGTGSSATVDVRVRAGASAHVVAFVDYGLVKTVVAGSSVTADYWRGRLAALATAKTLLLTKESPESQVEDAYALALLGGFFGSLLLPVALEGRRRSGDAQAIADQRDRPLAQLPLTLRPWPVNYLALLILGLFLLGWLLDPFSVPLVRYTVSAGQLALLALYGGGIVWTVMTMLRSRIEVRDDAIRISSWRGASEVSYYEIERVSVRQAGRARLLAIGVRGAEREVTAHLENYTRLDQARVIDVLASRARSATFTDEAQLARRGEASRSGLRSLIPLMSWRAERLSDRLPTIEIVMPAVMLVIFVPITIAGLFGIASGDIGFGLLMFVLGALFCGFGFTSYAQWLNQRRLQARLKRSGVLASGRVIETSAVSGTGGPSYTLVRYEFTTPDGTVYRRTAFDVANVAERWRTGDTVQVRYDPLSPRHALLEPGTG